MNESLFQLLLENQKLRRDAVVTGGIVMVLGGLAYLLWEDNRRLLRAKRDLCRQVGCLEVENEEFYRDYNARPKELQG